ncbi:MAG: DUF3592 domain-containing protein, partial [Rhodococcus sp. (in: high G+C Gram-positive bacteria)]
KVDPDLVRVAGRNATVALIPAGSVIVVTWLLAGPSIWYLRKREAQAAGSAPVASS